MSQPQQQAAEAAKTAVPKKLEFVAGYPIFVAVGENASRRSVGFVPGKPVAVVDKPSGPLEITPAEYRQALGLPAFKRAIDAGRLRAAA
jgi:hypothetical protein